jgi:predicted transcriptional regulator
LFNFFLCEDFFRIHQSLNEQQQSIKHLLYFANIQNSVGTELLSLLLNGESISDTGQKLCYTKQEDSSEYLEILFS